MIAVRAFSINYAHVNGMSHVMRPGKVAGHTLQGLENTRAHRTLMTVSASDRLVGANFIWHTIVVRIQIVR
jgi:hypothetical protein